MIDLCPVFTTLMIVMLVVEVWLFVIMSFFICLALRRVSRVECVLCVLLDSSTALISLIAVFYYLKSSKMDAQVEL